MSIAEKNNEHFVQEQTAWLKTLERLRLENLLLKNKLIEIIKKEISKEQLERAEFFHGLFLDKDTVIALLRRDIARQAAKAVPDNAGQNGYMHEQEKLKDDISRMEKEFTTVKEAFNRFVTSI